MTTIKHAFTNPKSDGADATITRPSDWNAAHVFTGYTEVWKGSAQIVNNSTTLVNANDMLVALAASEVWRFEAQLWYESGTTPDIKFAFTVPSGATLWWHRHGADEAGTVFGSGVVVGSGTSDPAQGGGAGSIRSIHIRGLVVNSTTAGNLQLQFAQNSTNASDTTLHANSTLTAWRKP